MDAIARRLSKEELELRAFRAAEIAEPLKALSETDGWRILKEAFERQAQAYYDKLSRDLMKGAEIDQRKLDYNRGGFDFVRDLLDAPENAEKVLDKAIERLRARINEDEADKGSDLS